MPEFYIWIILLINQLGETGEKQISVFGSGGGGGGGGANLPLNARTPLANRWYSLYVPPYSCAVGN